MSEEWKKTGNCKQCRRREYCKKQCKANGDLTLRLGRLATLSSLGMLGMQRERLGLESAKKAFIEACAKNEIPEGQAQGMAERCKALAARSEFTQREYVESLLSVVKEGKDPEEYLSRLEMTM